MQHNLGYTHNPTLVVLSILIAIFASYTAIDFAYSISATKGKSRILWLIGGSLAMGIGIWSMHFIGMLAFSIPGISIYYDITLCLLSIIVAILASSLALYIIGTKANPTASSYAFGSLAMGAAIAGMHYIGIWSMRMYAVIKWNLPIVVASVLWAIIASFVALVVAFKLRKESKSRGFAIRAIAGILLGIAIAGMHYLGMMAMRIVPTMLTFTINDTLLATHGLASAVVLASLFILSIAILTSSIDRILTRRTNINNALKDAIKARDEFFSVASHELRTPLTSIKLQNQMILRSVSTGQVPPEKLITMLTKSNENIDRLNRLVEDMLDISRLSISRLTIQREEFDLGVVLNEVIERVSPLLSTAGCELKLTVESPLQGHWDKFRLEQVITNILTNAAKYAPNGPVEIVLKRVDNSALLSIKDYGPGIANSDQDRIFGRFERANNEVRGMGLGLYIVKEIVEMHQGNIKLLSNEKTGSEFIVQLPIV